MHTSFCFRLTKTDRTFSWAGEKYKDLPIVRDQNGAISQPIAFSMGYLARTKAEGASSLQKRAYTLREWAEFLWKQGATLREGSSDAMMHRYAQAQRDGKAVISESTIAIKLNRIFEFYLNLPEAMGFWEDGTKIEELVGRPGQGRPITAKRTNPSSAAPLRWSGQGKVKASPARPSVLNNDEVQAILEAARRQTVSNDPAVAGGPQRHISLLVGERNWLLASCMSRGGLRAAETTDISITSITEALRKENLLRAAEAKFGKIGSIADIADQPDVQELVLSALKAFEHKSRRMYIYVDIVGKGNKSRHAAFPIDLVRDILLVGIWTVRRHQLKTMLAPVSTVDDNVFLSFKTCRAMLPGSVSDLIKEAFVSAGIEGSGHGLRKFYATNTANKILKRTLDDLGYLTQAVLNTVYDQVASALGHENVNTTTKYYVNLAMVQFTGLEARRQRRKLLSIWEMLISQQERLDPERIRLCGTAIRSIATAPRDSDLYGIIHGALTDPTINPEGTIKFAAPKPNIRLAVSNTDL